MKKVKMSSLLKDGMLYTIGSLLLQASSFITMPIFLRILSVEDYGVVSLFTSWNAFLSIILTLQLSSSIPNAKNKYNNFEFKEYIFNINLFLFFMYFFYVLIIFCFIDFFNIIIGLDKLLIFLMIINIIFGNIVNQKMTLYQFDNKAMNRLFVSFILMISSIILSIYFIQVVFSNNKYFARIFGMTLPTIVLGVYFTKDILLLKKFKLNKKYLDYAMYISIPLIFHNLAGYVLNLSDRIIIEKLVNIREAGFYSFSYNMGIIVNIVYASLNTAWVPWYFKNYKNKKYDIIKNYSRRYSILGLILFVGFIMLVPELVNIIAPLEYISSLKIIPIISLSYFYGFLYSFPVNYEFLKEKTKYIAYSTATAAFLNIILNLIFIPKYQSLGAAVATLISSISVFLLHECVVRFKMKRIILSVKTYIYLILFSTISVYVYYAFLANIFIRYIFTIFIIFFILFVEFLKLRKERRH